MAALYLFLGLLVAIIAGMVIGHLKMEPYLEDWVRAIQAGSAAPVDHAHMPWAERMAAGWAHVQEIVGKVWP